MAYVLRVVASRVRRLGAPEYRGKRAERLYLHFAWLLAEGRRLALRNEKVVVLSWPKSGRTWLRYMLDRLGLHLEYTHSPRSPPFPGGWDRKRIIFLHRDPRDTTVSHWFSETRRMAKYSGSLSDFLRDPDEGLEPAMRFNLLWKERLERAGKGLILTYEALHADTAGELARAVAFLGGRAVRDEALREAVAAGRFENMRAVETTGRGFGLYGDALAPGDPADPDSFKTREGSIGGWRRHFSPADAAFADALLERHDYFRRMSPACPVPTTISAPS